jgi:hypothetical protein
VRRREMAGRECVFNMESVVSSRKKPSRERY